MKDYIVTEVSFMKKTFILILILVCFSTSQARPYGGARWGGGPFWVPVATVVTIFGLISLNNQNERRDYEDGVRETAILIEEADNIEELNRIKRTHSRYFTESVQSLYRERKNTLSNLNYSYENITKEEQLTIFLIQDASSLKELEKIKKERLEYFSERVQEEYFQKKKSMK
jgi:hypothetical protein